ncbi:phosphoglucosamine mutase [Wenzhouxiangella sp. XN79A]|uniref:phosphoglucosamine mutase n=1 Tax=Wenzhouxiangella sp. XN79A TaxID=2724193 RepID=UPI00144ABEFA|nr:phosphoglucosamine mutase [Wenzhouxiangella sp. XN79A]NKI34721.1 phosphoglucosamine mutase [Wenzhouxiangella sp. XN79A]
MGFRYFGTDGIRGRVGESPITAEFALKLGWATGHVLGDRDHGRVRVVIGKDTRISGYLFESALEAGLAAAGAEVLLLGPMPTPAVAHMTRSMGAAAGIVISASHNPYYDNGIKYFSSSGQKLDDSVQAAIEDALEAPMSHVPPERLGKARRIEDATGRYVEFCKGTVGHGIRLDGLKLVVDCAHGATFRIAPHVFRELGAEVVALNCAPDGLNINRDCGSTHPDGMAETVVAEGADAGIAFDGDGDRVILADGRGRIVDGDAVIYALAMQRRRQRRLSGGVVGTVMTNFGLEEAFAEAGIDFVRARVGDRYVHEALIERGWVLGGEASGHILCLDRATTGCGIVSALQVLEAMVVSGRTLAELTEGLHRYPQVMINVPVGSGDRRVVHERAGVATAIAATERELAGAGRVVLRPSGTEPVVRVMVEAAETERARQLAESLAETVQRETSA